MSCEWDPRKAEANFRKHGVRFSEAEPVFADDYADTIADDESDPDEQRFVSIGTGVRGEDFGGGLLLSRQQDSHPLRTPGRGA
jgi:uncharacterized DUF497 family protein